MDASRFDRWTQTFTRASSRRSMLGLAGAAFGLTATRLLSISAAKKKHKKKSKKPKLNEYGCLDVGQACGGNSESCCSGICEGKKPKKGKKDKSRCVAHDVGGCSAGQHSQLCGGAPPPICTTSAGDVGNCQTTTGNAGYCLGDGQCWPCAKDADCQPFCGLRAACITCQLSCDAFGGTICAGPTMDSCTFPAP